MGQACVLWDWRGQSEWKKLWSDTKKISVRSHVIMLCQWGKELSFHHHAEKSHRRLLNNALRASLNLSENILKDTQRCLFTKYSPSRILYLSLSKWNSHLFFFFKFPSYFFIVYSKLSNKNWINEIYYILFIVSKSCKCSHLIFLP